MVAAMMIDWRICAGFVQIAICNYQQRMDETNLEKRNFLFGSRLIGKPLTLIQILQDHTLFPKPLCRVYFHTSGKKEEKAEFVKSLHRHNYSG